MFLFFLWYLWVFINSPCSMCKGVENTVPNKKVVVAVPMKVLVCVGRFPGDCCQ